MMKNKLCLLFATAFVFIKFSALAVNTQPRKSNLILNLKEKIGTYNTDDDHYSHSADNAYEYGSVKNAYSTVASYPYGPYSLFNTYYQPILHWPGSPVSVSRSSYDDLKQIENQFRFQNKHVQPTLSSPSSSEKNSMLGGDPGCRSIIDLEYPVFSDLCGAVPQARYALPNLLGHHGRWDVAYFLSIIVGAAKDKACISSLRILLCPMLFPPCRKRYYTPPVLPCQSYCHAVKVQCAIPTLNVFPCEILPYSSDLCPTNQPYGSFIPTGTNPSMIQSSAAISPAIYSTSGIFQTAQSPMANPDLPSTLSTVPVSSGPSAAARTSANSISPVHVYNSAPRATGSARPMTTNFQPHSNTNTYQQALSYAQSIPSSIKAHSIAEAHRSNQA